MDDSKFDTLPLFSWNSSASEPRREETALQVYPAQRQASEEILFDEVRAFSAFGQSSVEFTQDGIPYFVNEYWTSGQRQAHAIHEISYRACFKPQLPEFFISRLTRPGDAVLDPFMGRGTTIIQAGLMGRRPVGNDINPLSVLLTRPRLSPPSLRQIAERLDAIPLDMAEIDREDLLAFYSPKTLTQICALRNWLATSESLDNPVDDWIRMVAINRLTGHSPGFFSVYTLPPNQAASVKAQIKINEKRKQTPPDRDIKKIIIKKSKSLLSSGSMARHPTASLMTGSSSSMSAIASGSIDLVVTSPPFLDIVQYAEDNWLRSWFAGIDVNSVNIAHHKKEAAWQAMVAQTLHELARVVRPGGHIAFEVGEVRNGKVLLEQLVWSAADLLPLEKLFVMVNQQEFTKTANCWGVANNNKGTNSNRIVILRRQ